MWRGEIGTAPWFSTEHFPLSGSSSVLLVWWTVTPKRRWRNPLGRWGSIETWEMRQSQHTDRKTALWVRPANKFTLLGLCHLPGQPPKGQAGPIQKTNPGNWSGWSKIKHVHILKNKVTPDDKDIIILHQNFFHFYGITIWSDVWLHLLLLCQFPSVLPMHFLARLQRRPGDHRPAGTTSHPQKRNVIKRRPQTSYWLQNAVTLITPLFPS